MGEQRIIIMDSDLVARKAMKSMLKKLGYWIIGEASDGLQGLKLVRTRQPDLVIIDAGLPGMDDLEVPQIIHEDKLAPVILLSSGQTGILEKAKDARVYAMLLKPVEESVLFSTVELAMVNYQELVKLEVRVKDMHEMLEQRKLVEKAKGILMQSMGLSEGEAFRRMQKQSMNKRVSLRAVAEAVIMAHNLNS